MRIRLRGAQLSDDARRANDTYRIFPIVAFFLILFAYIYTFTQAYEYLNLPSPQEFAETWLGVETEHVFDSDHNVDSRLHVQATSRYKSDDERLIVFGVIAGAFLCGYFLPLRYRRKSFVLWFLVAYVNLYGLDATALFVAGHLLVYTALHRSNKDSALIAAVCAFLAAFAMAGVYDYSEETGLTWGLAAVCLYYPLYLKVLQPLLMSERMGPIIRTACIQAPMIFGVIGALQQGVTGSEWKLPLGLLFLFWQWERLIIYHVDYKAGDVPKDLPLSEYLAVFMSPAVIFNFRYAPYVGQSYSYLNSNYLVEDKNSLVLSGVRIWGLALCYLIMHNWIVETFIGFMDTQFDVTVYKYTSKLVRLYVQGTEMSTPTVLLSTLLDQSRIFLIYGAVTHFRVGTWRVLGYRMEPQYNRPWLATNLVSFWGRFAFHYREFLVRAFYYPMFFRFFKKRNNLRIFTATFFATAIGNMLWGHIPDRLYYRGIEYEHLVSVFLAWPYYLLLGLSISLTQLYLLRKKRTRKPWTRDWRILLDVACAYMTMQFFSIIHIFGRPHPDGEFMDYLRLFLIGFGIHL